MLEEEECPPQGQFLEKRRIADLARVPTEEQLLCNS